MHDRLILIAIIAIGSATAGLIPCNCGLSPCGEDICANPRCVPMVVRPKELERPIDLPKPKVVCAPVAPPIPPLLPIGGPCTCQEAIVKPAIVPKPICPKCCAGSFFINDQSNRQLNINQQNSRTLIGGCGCGGNGCAGPIVGGPGIITGALPVGGAITSLGAAQLGAGNVLLGGGEVYTAGGRPLLVEEVAINPLNPANFVPADAVSISLAYKEANDKSRVNGEDILSFGFRKLPKDQPSRQIKRGRNIPEENLFKLNGEIVELKKILNTNPAKSLAEEAIEDLEQLEAEEQENLDEDKEAGVRKLTLGDVGYGLAKLKYPDFIDVPVAKPVSALEEAALAAVKDCKDGFLPGNVIIKQTPHIEIIEPPPPLPESCYPTDDDELPIWGDNESTIFSSSSSSSSSCNSENRFTSLLIDRLL